jgi:hypothetical protein
MSLNEDVLSLILEELKDDKKSLYSCLFVNRIWCVITIPILWRNPNPQYHFNPYGLYYTFDFNNSTKILFDKILLHLSEETRNTLNNQGININNLIKKTYKRPLFNYINFWKYLNLLFIENMINDSWFGERSKVTILRNEIYKLFINKNTKFIHLTILKHITCQSVDLDYPIHNISGFEYCFSKLESIHCNNYINEDILKELAKICKSIKKLRFDIICRTCRTCQTTTNGIFKLIDVQKNLNDVHFSRFVRPNSINIRYLEKSLIKHADTIQYLRLDGIPIMRLKTFLSHFVNLLRLDIIFDVLFGKELKTKNLSLPNLKILKVRLVLPNIITNIIKNANGHLTEISLFYDDDNNHDDEIKKIIQEIYQNCPNLKYFKLSYSIGLPISELENLLINCQFLNGLVIDTYNNSDMDKLFKILIKSSPITLFKFEFFMIKLENVKLFLDNWKDRNPILLKLSNINYFDKEIKQQLEIFAEEYKAKGIIKKYFIGYDEININEDFDWN